MIFEAERIATIRNALDGALGRLDEDERGDWLLGNDLRAAQEALQWIERGMIAREHDAQHGWDAPRPFTAPQGPTGAW